MSEHMKPFWFLTVAGAGLGGALGGTYGSTAPASWQPFATAWLSMVGGGMGASVLPMMVLVVLTVRWELRRPR